MDSKIYTIQAAKWVKNKKCQGIRFGYSGVLNARQENIIQELTTDKSNILDLLYQILDKLVGRIEIEDVCIYYPIAKEHVEDIFHYIKEHGTITEDIVHDILQKVINDGWDIKIMTIGEFREQFTNLVPFSNQRNINYAHVDNLYREMKKSALDKTFPPSNITLLKKKDHYQIIDGMHRIEVIKHINPREKLLLSKKISVTIQTLELSSQENNAIFQNVNSTLPISELHLNEDFIEKLHTFIEDNIKKTYGAVITTDQLDKKIAPYITKSKLHSDLSENNIKKYAEQVQYVVDLNEIWRYFMSINQAILDVIYDIVEIEEEKFYEKSIELEEIQVLKIWKFIAYLNRDWGSKPFKLLHKKDKILLTKTLTSIRHNRNVGKNKLTFVLGLVPASGLFDCIKLIDDYRKIILESGDVF